MRRVGNEPPHSLDLQSCCFSFHLMQSFGDTVVYKIMFASEMESKSWHTCWHPQNVDISRCLYHRGSFCTSATEKWRDSGTECMETDCSASGNRTQTWSEWGYPKIAGANGGGCLSVRLKETPRTSVLSNVLAWYFRSITRLRRATKTKGKQPWACLHPNFSDFVHYGAFVIFWVFLKVLKWIFLCLDYWTFDSPFKFAQKVLAGLTSLGPRFVTGNTVMILPHLIIKTRTLITFQVSSSQGWGVLLRAWCHLNNLFQV